jgi:hypothetical protein
VVTVRVLERRVSADNERWHPRVVIRRATASAGCLLFATACGEAAVGPAPAAAPPPSAPPSSGLAQAPIVEAPPADAAPSPPPAPAAPADVPPPGFSPIPERRKGAFPGVAFAEVRAFAFDLEVSERPMCGAPLDADGSLCSTVERPGVVLSAEQSRLLVDLLKKPATYGPGSKCFLPHHGFVFYDAAGVPVADVSLCFMCNMVAGRPALLAAGKHAEGTRAGLGEEGNGRLRALCKELGLPKCDATRPDDFGPRESR